MTSERSSGWFLRLQGVLFPGHPYKQRVVKCNILQINISCLLDSTQVNLMQLWKKQNIKPWFKGYYWFTSTFWHWPSKGTSTVKWWLIERKRMTTFLDQRLVILLRVCMPFLYPFFLYHLEMYSQIEIVLPFRDLFLHFYPIFCEIFQTPNNNKKLQKAIKPRLCEPTKFALDTRRWHCYVILPSDGLYIKCAYGSLLQLRNITPWHH